MRKIFLLILISVSVLSFSHADLKIASDPATLGIGARTLGMGGLILNFQDISSLYGNPATLSRIENRQYMVMTGRFVNEVDYLCGGMAIPTNIGVLGFGYISSQITYTGSVATTEVVDGVIIIPATTEVSTSAYRNSGLYFSFAKLASEITGNDRFDNLRLGGTLKIFSQDLSVPSQHGSATGYEVDLGFQYSLAPWFNLSAVGKNVLPASMGGRLVWSPTDRVETYPYYIRTGFQADLHKRFKMEGQKITFGIEFDYHPHRNAPDLLHYGIEWGIGDILDLRVGLDQSYLGQGGVSVFQVGNNMTYGVGITHMGWRFDYARHEYYGLTANSTNYFSLTYGLPYEKEEKKPMVRIKLDPKDKSVVYAATVPVSGMLLDKRIEFIDVNDKQMNIIGREVSGSLDLALGKNKLMISGLDKNQAEIFSEKRRILRLIDFNDVPLNYWAKKAISSLATLGIIKGFPENIFKPESGISRAEFATLLARTAGYDGSKINSNSLFIDLPEEHWAAGAVAYAVEKGLVKGYPDDTFKPNKKISRAEGVAVVARFAGLDLDTPVDEIPYIDVPGRYWAVKEISAAKTAGLLAHISGNFEPNEDMSRAETAQILSRVSLLKKKIDDLFDFEVGYLMEEKQ
jgi:S-layer homology domain